MSDVSRWPTYALTDVFEIRSGLSKSASEFGSGYPFVTFKDVLDNYFLPETLGSLVRSSETERELCDVRRGDVFLTRTSETQEELGMSSVALRDYDSATFNGFTKRLRPKDPSQIVPEYAAYYFRSPRFRSLMSGYSSLSTRASLNNDMLSRLEIILPDVRTQEEIGYTLRSLDDKIEQNRRTAKALEKLARATFKAWFVDFEPVKAKAAGAYGFPGMPHAAFATHPDCLTDSPLGPLPEGWAGQTVGDIATLSRQQIDPQDHPDELFEHFSIPAYDAGQNPVIEPGIGIKSQKFVLAAGCVLLSKLNPRIPRVWLPVRPSGRRQIASTEFLVAIPKPDWTREFLYCLFQQREFRDGLAQSASGTSNSHQRVRPSDLLTRMLVVPPKAMLNAFDDQVIPQMALRQALQAETSKLATLRDYLLPQLLSGDVRVKFKAAS